MIEILPLKVLTDEDAQIFGKFNTVLAKLSRAGIDVPAGIVISPPIIKLQTALNYYDLGSRELYEQNLKLLKNHLHEFPLPEILSKKLQGKKKFLIGSEVVYSPIEVWRCLLQIWFGEIKQKLWLQGFSPQLAQNLEAIPVFFVHSPKSFGSAYCDEFLEDMVIKSTFSLDPDTTQNINDLVRGCDKKLLIPHLYQWILDKTVKLVGVSPYIQQDLPEITKKETHKIINTPFGQTKQKVATKVFLNLSDSNTQESGIDGVYIASEKLIDKANPANSINDLIAKILQLSSSSDLPILFKFADIPEQLGGVRGSLRLLHQKSLMQLMIHILTFVRHKKNLNNLHPVVPFVRSVSELMAIKQELSAKKIIRKPSLQIWMEAAVPENIINLEDYLEVGIDGVVLNLDELVSFLNGFDPDHEELAFYKNEVSGLLKFIEDGLKLLHKSKVPFIVTGSLSLYPQVLEFLVEKGVYGVVVERYEAPSAKDLLHNVERRVIFKKTAQ